MPQFGHLSFVISWDCPDSGALTTLAITAASAAAATPGLAALRVGAAGGVAGAFSTLEKFEPGHPLLLREEQTALLVDG